MASFSTTMISLIFFNLILTIISTKTHLSFPSTNSKTPFLNSTDIHQLLPLYGFPKGLLPNNVKSFTVFSGHEDGIFEIELETECYVKFDDRVVYYNKKIKGKLSYGFVKDVYGIQVKKMFFWVSVSGIKANERSRTIDFYVGILSETLSVELFNKIPTCKNNDLGIERTEVM